MRNYNKRPAERNIKALTLIRRVRDQLEDWATDPGLPAVYRDNLASVAADASAAVAELAADDDPVDWQRAGEAGMAHAAELRAYLAQRRAAGAVTDTGAAA